MVHATRVPRAEPLESVSEDSSVRLTREQVVERIISLNATASVEFLAGFNDEELRAYLDHLQVAQFPRGGRWSRPGGSPAIVSRTAGP